MKQIRTTIESPYEPNDNGALWIDTSNPDAPIAKVHSNGEWKAISPGEIVTEIDKDSTDEQIPTAKATNDRITALANEVGVDLDKYKEYFTIEATEDDTTIYFRQSSYAANEGFDPLKVEVSTDNGESWTEITAFPAEDDVPGATLASLNAGEKVLIRGKNPAYGYYSENEGEPIENCNFWSDQPCYAYGNIMSLIGGDDFSRLSKVGPHAFCHFFSDYDTELDWSWVLSKDGNSLLLPATILSTRCYQSMFSGCTSLTSAPSLPATTLSDYCYNNMFNGCTSLTSAPALPATTLTNECYNCMFFNCTNLAYIKALFTTTPSSTYTDNWVSGVKATGTFVKSSDAAWSVTGNDGVPSGWTIKEQDPAQRNDQADWEETNSSSASYIWNKPETHVLHVRGAANTFEETLAMVRLDDRAITFQRLKELTPLNTVITCTGTLLSLNLVDITEAENIIYLEGGVISDSFGKTVAIYINFSPDEEAGNVSIYEV